MVRQVSHMHQLKKYYTLDNSIDGESLVSLIADIEEFKFLVSESAWRMKIKKIVRQV